MTALKMCLREGKEREELAIEDKHQHKQRQTQTFALKGHTRLQSVGLVFGPVTGKELFIPQRRKKDKFYS